MNFPLLTAVAQSDLPPLQRLLLLMLLNHADKSGRAWPSHATLARETGMGERSVWAHMQSLEKAGWLIRAGQVNRVGVFTIVDPAAPAPSIPRELRDACAAAPHPPRDDSAAPAGHSAAAAASLRSCCGQTTQEPLNNHPGNHPIMEEGRPPPQVGAASSPAQTALSARPRNTGWREWHRQQADAANAVLPPPHLPREFAEAWQRYRDYRTQRATAARVSSEAVAWTANAAGAALRSCERHAQAHGWAAVVAQIDTAIGGSWQGLHFPSGPPRRAGALRPAAGRWKAYQEAEATAGYTDEEILNFMPPRLSLPATKQ